MCPCPVRVPPAGGLAQAPLAAARGAGVLAHDRSCRRRARATAAPLLAGRSCVWARSNPTRALLPCNPPSWRRVQPVERQQQMIRECFTLISKRSDRVCNFLEDVGAWSKDTKLVRCRARPTFFAGDEFSRRAACPFARILFSACRVLVTAFGRCSAACLHDTSATECTDPFTNTQVYRVYATLYFIFVVDGSESELGILDLVHVFVESLDHVRLLTCFASLYLSLPLSLSPSISLSLPLTRPFSLPSSRPPALAGALALLSSTAHARFPMPQSPLYSLLCSPTYYCIIT